MTEFIPQFGGVAFTLIAFVVALSIIVAVHEYGHYIVGRWSGIHAEVFSLGFGPVLYSRVDKRGTQWQIAALPFGGYVKFLGDANAASVGVDEAVPEADRRRTMNGAPLWARAATVAAGPIFNFILSVAVFASVIMWEGRPVDPVRVASLDALPASYVNELQPGDVLLAVSGIEVDGVETIGEVFEQVPREQVLDYTVERDGIEMVVRGPFPFPTLASGLSPGSAAYETGMKVGDVITAVDGEPIFAFEQLVEIVTASEGRELSLTIWRDGEELTLPMSARRQDLPQDDGSFETRWLIGMSGGLFFGPETESPGLFSAISDGASEVVRIITSSISGLYHMITGAISTCNLSGPVGIAQASGAMASQGGMSFIWFVAVLSTAVGLLNLFPVPVLDGGHLVFHGYEAVSGKPPTESALRVLMAIGLSLILTLMVFAIANDLFLCP